MFKTINAIKIINDYLFPIFCFGCQREGVWLCPECFAKMEINTQKACPVCHSYNNNGDACLGCVEKSFLDRHMAAIKYEENKIIGDLMRNFKYNFVEGIFEIFEGIIINFLAKERDYFANIDMVVPVPLHGRRLAERGFNQAELIAAAVAKIIHKKTLNKAIARHRYTSVQARLNKSDRARNVFGAFVLGDSIEIKNKNILLVDDVFTTGSTLQECAKICKENGAQAVFGFTIARG